MALLPKKYNTPENSQGMDDRSPLPSGDYVVAITRSEIKQTKAKNGHYLAIGMKVLQGPHAGRMLFENLNLDNPNPIAVEIADKTLNSICKACGKAGIEDSSEIHDIPMTVTVVEDDSNPQYPGNIIRAYNPANSFEVTEQPAQAAPATPQPTGKLPWE